MKKIGTILLLAVLAVSVLPAQETTGTAAEAAVRDNSFGINVLGAVGGLIFGSVDIMIEYQHAFGPHLALLVTPEVLFGTGFWGIASGVGLNIYPMGKYLHGFFISLFPVGGVVGAGGYIFPYFGAFLRLGFEWVFDSGFLLSLGGGGRWDNYRGLGPNLVLTLGYAW
jgi:hypothetical protein